MAGSGGRHYEDKQRSAQNRKAAASRKKIVDEWSADPTRGGKYNKGQAEYYIPPVPASSSNIGSSGPRHDSPEKRQQRANNLRHNQAKRKAERGAQELVIEGIQAETAEIKRVTKASIPWGTNRTAATVQQAKMQAMRRRGGGMSGFRRTRARTSSTVLG